MGEIGTDKNKKGDLVIVGEKPVRNYVVACITLFNAGTTTIRVRARGKHISRAVDTVELLRRVFIKDLNIKEIKIGTDELVNEEGKDVGVSIIEITLTKPETVNRVPTYTTRLLGRRRW